MSKVQIIELKFIIYASKEHWVFPMFLQEILHRKKSGASCNEVIENDDVRLIGQVVWIKHSPHTLLATAMSTVEVEGNAKFLSKPFRYERSEIAFLVSAHGSSHYRP